MQEPEAGWDPLSVSYHIDAATRLTGVYLAVSILVFMVLAIRFLPALARFKASLGALRAQASQSSDDAIATSATSSARASLEVAHRRFRVAVASLRQWAKLTVLILLGYSAVEIAELFREISMQRRTGISAFSGSLANIFAMWSPAIWFLVALCVADWILSVRLARSTAVQSN